MSREMLKLGVLPTSLLWLVTLVALVKREKTSEAGRICCTSGICVVVFWRGPSQRRSGSSSGGPTAELVFFPPNSISWSDKVYVLTLQVSPLDHYHCC